MLCPPLRLALVLPLLALAAAASGAAPTPMASPDGQIVATLLPQDDGTLRYAVRFHGTTVIEPSPLGITLDGTDLGSGVTAAAPARASVDAAYPTRGHHTRARDRHEQFTFPVTHAASGRGYELQFRIADDGVAYRYVVPGVGVQHVDGEASGWNLSAGSEAWHFERDSKKWKLASYAGEWIRTAVDNLPTVSSVGPVQGTPMVVELPGDAGYAVITKAALYRYSGMRLRATGGRALVADFTEGPEGFDVEGAVTTPWRVTMLARDLNSLVTSDLIKNLNPAPDPRLFADTSYIKPGRSVWRFETLDTGNPDEESQFVNYAADMGVEYSLIDDGWKDWDTPWESVTEICAHAAKKNVGVWVWVHSHDLDEPANDYRDMRAYFDRAVEAGVVGIKIDFMDGETKTLIDFEIAALRLAAERRLMINFHGCHASTGEERTYPNEVTREGVRGLEVNKHHTRPLPAWHNAALPFTRYLVGHADYTPIAYTKPGPTTWAHQLANMVTLYSPMQVFADHPAFLLYDVRARVALDVLLSIPTVWDETRVLPGSQIGELAAIARRSGDRWFVGVTNGADARDYTLDLAFLGPGAYDAVGVLDDPDAPPVDLVGLNRKARLHGFTTAVPFKRIERRVDATQTHAIPLADGGGFVGVFTPR